ncbi:MAG: helix-hairpin-helix domain-containing protein [Verrucomicrobiota bacterium]
MKSTLTSTPNTKIASLGHSHGYRFESDSVTLNASFDALPSADSGRTWSLRLLATPGIPTNAEDLQNAHLITEVPLPPMSELTGAVDNFESVSGALTPAGRGAHVITLALLSHQNGGASEFHDFSTYAHSETFAHPRFCDTVGITLNEDTVTLSLDCIENPRASGNTSGTLSVEVWATATPYTGGRFTGEPVAGAILGNLEAGQIWTPGTFTLHAERPSTEAKHLVVMLREWNGAAFVSRDYLTFDAPTPSASPCTTDEKAHAPVAPSAEAIEASPVVSETKPAASEIKPTVSEAKSSEDEQDSRISINTATAEVLNRIAGLNKTLVATILKKRPFKTLTDLAKVKGIGTKTFDKIKALVKL